MSNKSIQKQLSQVLGFTGTVKEIRRKIVDVTNRMIVNIEQQSETDNGYIYYRFNLGLLGGRDLNYKIQLVKSEEVFGQVTVTGIIQF